MNCPAHPWAEPTGLPCTRTDPHQTGHTFEASWCADAHDVERGEDA